MHIVEAFEKAVANKSAAQKELNNLAMELVRSNDPQKIELAVKLQSIGEQVGSILEPLTGE